MVPTKDIDELIALAYRDDLTGLYNRRYFRQVLTRPLEESSTGEPYCFLLLDIDFFKEINDTYGHRAGDRVLTGVARLLEEFVDSEDTAIRYAGDEFILFFPGMDRESGLQRAQEIVKKAQRTVLPLNGRDEFIQLTFSVGVASHPEDGDSWEEIIEKADQSLYAAKQRGRNCASLPPDGEKGIPRGDDLSSLFPCPEYVGQAEAIDEVFLKLAAWNDGRQGGPSPFFLCLGERGSGRSRFLKEIANRIQDGNLCVTEISGSEALRALPFGALIKGLIDRFGSADRLRERVGSDLPGDQGPLWEAVFSGTSAEPGLDNPEVSARFLLQVLEAIHKRDPLVMLIDDADLLDMHTVSLLDAIRHTEDSPLRPFVLLAISEEEFAPGRRRSGTEAGAESSAPEAIAAMDLPVLELKPLRGEDVERMVRAVLPTLRVEPDFFTELLLQSRGNPTYIEESLKYLIQTGRLFYHRSAWRWKGSGLDDLPDSLESLLENRLECLEPEVRGLIEKASMMGPEVEPGLIRQLEQSNEGHLWDLLDKACTFGVLQSPSRWKDDDLRFTSRTAQEVSYEQVPEQDRITWHLRMARLFESLQQKPDLLHLGPLLYHAQMAGLQAELETIRQRHHLLGHPSRATLVSVPSRKKKRTGPIESHPIPPDGWGRILPLFHLLRGAIQSLRLYPETSPTVTSACQRLLEGLTQAFGLVESVHFSEADGVLLINGEPPPWKGEERAVSEGFYRFLSDAGLKDISFQKGLTLPELKAFLNTWNAVLTGSQDPAAGWEAFEDRPDVRHVSINAKVYVAISDGDISTAGPVLLATEPQEAPAGRDLSGVLASLQSTLLSIQESGGPDPLHPEHASDLRLILEKLRELSPVLEMNGSARSWSETPAPSQAEQNGPTETQASEHQASMLAQCPDADLFSDSDVRCFLADILSGEPFREARGYQQISQMGTKAVEPLYALLCETPDPHAGRICARFLKPLAPDLGSRIKGVIESRTDPAVKLRVLQHGVPVLSEDDSREILTVALQQEQEPIVREALQQLRTRFPAEASRLLLDLVPLCPEATRHEICLCLGELGDSRCIGRLLGYLDQASARTGAASDGLVQDLCYALGYFPDPRVVHNLSEILSTKRWPPWRRKRASLGARKAALRALERIGGDEAYAAIRKVEHDKDPWIRFRARNFLQGRPRGDRPSTKAPKPAPVAPT